MTEEPSFVEHFVPREQGKVYARDYKGAGPACVLMHGFPDNLHIYDDLIPYLVASGRRVVAFDFLGFGASDKSPDASYSFKQQLGDLESVVDALGLDRIVPVAHDSSGPAAINFTLAHPKRVESLCILNSAYDDAFPVRWPEMRLPELGLLDIPVKVIWGEFDPYITLDVAKDRASHFRHASLHVLPAGHWLHLIYPNKWLRRWFHVAAAKQPRRGKNFFQRE
jgi:pimeloyl-ACP methyl ester carboxylesterase